jgi:hypothetical protein
VADNHHFVAAQIVPAAVDEGLMGQALRVARRSARRAIQAGAFPALHPGVGVDALHFADADVVVQRRANKLVAQRDSSCSTPSASQWGSRPL